MNIWLKELALVIILIIMTLEICVGSEYAEIRSPNDHVQAGSTFQWGPKIANSEFYGFYYDIDDNSGTESIILTISEGNILDGESRPTGIQYTTERQKKQFRQKDWGDYYVIGFLGVKYFAGHIEDPDPDAMSYLARSSNIWNLIANEQLTRVLIDDDTEKTVAKDSSIPLGEGYDLKVTSIDIGSNKICLELIKDGTSVDSRVVIPEIDNPNVENRTYYFKESSGTLHGLATIAVHFKNAFHGPDRDLATVDGIFQISERPESVKLGTAYGRMKISQVDPNYGIISMENLDNTIVLGKNMDIPLMGEIRIRTQEQNDDKAVEPLRFFIYKKITEPGIYLINGLVEDVVDGKSTLWNYKNFPGFYYDLDSDLGREELSMMVKIDNNQEDGILNPGDVIYRTSAQWIPFDFKDWGKYYAIGFMGERYFAGYITSPEKDRTSFLWDESDNSNMLSNDALSKILIDLEDDQNTTLSEGSAYPLKEGYKLRIKSIDVQGKKVLVSLAKDGNEIDQSVIEMAINPNYIYKKKLPVVGDFVIISVHFKELLSSQESNLAVLNAVWQISENPIIVRSGTDLSSNMAISFVNSREGDMAIEARNDDNTIKLRRNKTIDLMGDYYIKTADQEFVSQGDPLRFFVFKKVAVSKKEGMASPQEQAVVEPTAIPVQEKATEKKIPGYQIPNAMFCLGIALYFVKLKK